MMPEFTGYMRLDIFEKSSDVDGHMKRTEVLP